MSGLLFEASICSEIFEGKCCEVCSCVPGKKQAMISLQTMAFLSMRLLLFTVRILNTQPSIYNLDVPAKKHFPPNKLDM